MLNSDLAPRRGARSLLGVAPALSGQLGWTMPGVFITSGVDRPQAILEGQGAAQSTVVRLTPTEVWTTPFQIPLRKGEPVQLRLAWSDGEIGPMPATVGTLPSAFADNPWIALGVDDPGEHVGSQLVHLMQALCERGLVERPAESLEIVETITDPGVISRLTRGLLKPGRSASLIGGAPGSRVVLHSADPSDHWVWCHFGAYAGGPCTFEIEGYLSVYRITCDLVAVTTEHLITTSTRKVVRIRRRSHRRAAPARPLSVTFRHPIWQALAIDMRQVRDLSFDGLSFVTQTRRDLLFPGLVIPSLRVTGSDGAQIWLSAQVSSFRQVGTTQVCGLRVNPLDDEDYARWMDIVADGLHPSTDRQADWTGPAWELFRRSGYFSLSGKSPQEFDDLREHLANVTTSLAAARHLSCQTIFRSERGVEASFWSLRAYSGTWLGHQLAKLPSRKRPGEVLRDIYLRAFETAQRAANSRWLLCYIESHVRWNKDVHLGFSNRQTDSQRACAIPFNLVEVQCDGTEPHWMDVHELGPATKEEMVHLWETIANRYPRAYVEALDLVPSRWHLRDISAEWTKVGLERSRTFCVARRQGSAVAAAIIETGESGTNLFRLLDGVRLFELEPGGSEAFASLLAWARRHYARRGKKSFIYFMEQPRPELIERARLRDLGAGFIWITSTDLLPDFLEHLCQYTWEREANLAGSRAGHSGEPDSPPREHRVSTTAPSDR